MSLVAHAIQAVSIVPVLYPLYGRYAFVFAAAVCLIDLDHYIEYVYVTRCFDIKGMIKVHDLALNNMHGLIGLNIFHTFECYLPLLFLGFWHKIFFFVLGGFLFHHLFDQIALIKMGYPFARAFSILEYYWRRPYYTTLGDLIRRTLLKSE